MSPQSGGTVRRATSAFRSSPAREQRVLWALVVFSLVLTVLIWTRPDEAPFSSLVLPLLLGSLVLGPRHLPWFVVFVLVLVVLVQIPHISQGRSTSTARVVAVIVLFAAGLIILIMSFRRSRLGVAGAQGESMLIDLRDRILSQSYIPDLPHGFHAESALRSAGGTPFAGDFIVAARPPDTTRLEVAVVDVSGKGEGAGTRALLLAGAIGGLIGALPPSEFLPAANGYLLRQDWDEGFATAAHVSLDLETGRFEIRNAGHPPAAHRAAGSGRWQLLSDPGPALGLLDGIDFPVVTGELRPGDALMVYTDGMVETREKDIALGTDRMLGQSDQLLRDSFEGGAERLIRALGSRNDDRALVLVYRT
ncbi:PP2C family protein-serine/threonine phosphatase [Nocardioides sp.]|uniref:PP2C family protein-serine/threonine phosphatase n=1 Tax=Nocardioides sp. TaxID=35761 RepID=UPI002ED54F0F